MERIYCKNCLRETPAYPCPLCGYDPEAAPAVSQALEQCILHGRYLTGRALEKTPIGISYKALDLEENRPVSIREFFPAGQAQRQPDGSLSWLTPPHPEGALGTHSQMPEDVVLDSFSENNTIYTVFRPVAPSRKRPPQVRKKESEWLPFLLALLLFLLTIAAALPLLACLLP